MAHELWAELSAAISLVDQDFFDNGDYQHPTALIVRCHCWSVLHNQATDWACKRDNWDRAGRPRALPSQPTMSRRLRSGEFERFMGLLERRLGHLPAGPGVGSVLFKRLDAQPLPIAAHSQDRQAGWGRGAGQKSRGYKLHAIWCAARAVPLQWRVAPLQVSEQAMARRMLRDLTEPGYVGGDKNYDSNKLFDQADAVDNRLVCPRRYGPAKGLGHQYQSPHRLRSKDWLEGPTATLTGFGRQVMRQRKRIEGDFGNAVSFSGGLSGLPAWVRGHGRVRRWVWAKLLINAVRIRRLHRARARKLASGA